MRKSAFRIIMVLLSVIFLAACQPTPEKSAVVYKRDLEGNIVRSSASLAAYDAPKSWQETLEIGGSSTKIMFDATISIPDVTIFSVYEAKSMLFDSESVLPLLDYFVQDRAVIKPAKATKLEIEEELIIAKKNKEDDQWIEELERMYLSAPETIENEYVTDWNLYDSKTGGYINLGNNEYGSIHFGDHLFYYSEGDILTDDFLALNGEPEVGQLNITEKDAINAAEQTLSDLGINNMSAYCLKKAQIHPATRISGSWFSEEPQSRGYLITFVRSLDGISGRANEGSIWRIDDEFAYTAPFFQEEIDVYVNEQGKVQSFGWDGPLTITKKTPVNLMPFSDMQERIRDMLYYVFAYDGRDVLVDYISMNLTLVGVENESDTALYVPAWYIHCQQDHALMETGKTKIEWVIVLNAIDGGRVQEYPSPYNSKEH